MSDRPTVLVIGGGLAGLAAASALAPRGFKVTLLEARNRLGGRASSFVDSSSGQLVDNCQHVSMGCCTNLAHFFRTIGVAHLLEPQPCLYFMTADRRVSRLRADPLPAPFHLARSFWSSHYLSWRDKLGIAWGLACLKRTDAASDPPFLDWLRARRQTPRAIERFWGLILVSALNETIDNIGLRYARKVFVDGFLGHRKGFEVEVPAVPLGRLYGAELDGWLARHEVDVRLQCGAKQIAVTSNEVDALVLRDGERLQADWYILAVPFERVFDLLPGEVASTHDCFAKLRQLETSPITSVHLWYERRVLELPHVVLVDCLGQWLFDRGVDAEGVQYLQVVISASRALRELGHDEIENRVRAELVSLLPEAGRTKIVRARVVTEHSATFSTVPGVDQLRPGQVAPIGRLLLAGDWTATGWPATMEGAVRSGYLAAQAILEHGGRPEPLLAPELGA